MKPSPETMEPMEWAKYVIRNNNEKGYSDAYSTLVRESRLGNSEAEYFLGLMYARGQGVPKDYKAARTWFEKAYLQDNLNAAYFLGKIYQMGLGGNKDMVRAKML